MRRAILDTGPLIAFLDRAEQNHHWAVDQVEALAAPLLVCEPVLAEAMHLLTGFSKGQDALLGLLENGALRIGFHIEEHVPALRKLHHKYRDRPMSLADACIVRMTEIYERHAVLTLDSDFTIYRKHGRCRCDVCHRTRNGRTSIGPCRISGDDPKRSQHSNCRVPEANRE